MTIKIILRTTKNGVFIVVQMMLNAAMRNTLVKLRLPLLGAYSSLDRPRGPLGSLPLYANT